MSKSKEYLAVKNFFHNTLRVTRDDVKQIVRDVIKEMAADEIRKFCLTTEFRAVSERAVKWGLWDMKDTLARTLLEELISTRVAYEQRMKEVKK